MERENPLHPLSVLLPKRLGSSRICLRGARFTGRSDRFEIGGLVPPRERLSIQPQAFRGTWDLKATVATEVD